MRATKYIMSGGLAFSEDKDMETLRQYSLKGWHVRDFKFMGYTLEKGESADYIYSVDYQNLNEEEAAEYFDFFASAGWTHITSQGNMHLFRALPGTKPIHSDRATVAEKHHHLGSPMKWPAISLVMITLLLWVGAVLTDGGLKITIMVMIVIFSVISIPLSWTVLTIYQNKWRAEGKKGLANLVKFVPILFILFVAVMILLVVDNHSPFLMFAYMILGAITLPTIVWLIMSIYHKLRGKEA